MTLHRTLVLSLLVVTTVLALLYVSMFPAEPGNAMPEISGPDQRQEFERTVPVPAVAPERASAGRYAAAWRPGAVAPRSA